MKSASNGSNGTGAKPPLATDANQNPLGDMDEWEDDLLRRYPTPLDSDAGGAKQKRKEAFRDYAAEARPSVKEFYRLNHQHQTVDFVRAKRAEYGSLNRSTMEFWESLELLNTLVDDSDPDIDLPQIEHLLQTAEAIRADGRPRWFILAGLVHDLGKILCLYGEPQWAVVGDTFPVGCAYSPKIVYHEFFADNPDASNPKYASRLGIYEEGCGLDNVLLSWGHDEYVYQVMKDHLPEPALYMLRYHSFYPAHRETAYDFLMNDRDREMFHWVREFNRYDLYTKSDVRPNVAELRPFYEEIAAEYLPRTLRW